MGAIEAVAELVRSGQCRRIVVLTGAGVSVSAGIPDFRTPGTGLYDNLQEYGLPFAEAVFDLNFFRSDPAPFYRLCQELWPGRYAPTPTHRFIKLLEQKQLLVRRYTQNTRNTPHAPHTPLARPHTPYHTLNTSGTPHAPQTPLPSASHAEDPRTMQVRCYTQNIDSLESAAGLPKDKVVAAH